MGRKKNKMLEEFYKQEEKLMGIKRNMLRKRLRVGQAILDGRFSQEIIEKVNKGEIGTTKLDNMLSGTEFKHNIHFKVNDEYYNRIMGIKKILEEKKNKKITMSETMRMVILIATMTSAEMTIGLKQMYKDKLEKKGKF